MNIKMIVRLWDDPMALIEWYQKQAGLDNRHLDPSGAMRMSSTRWAAMAVFFGSEMTILEPHRNRLRRLIHEIQEMEDILTIHHIQRMSYDEQVKLTEENKKLQDLRYTYYDDEDTVAAAETDYRDWCGEEEEHERRLMAEIELEADEHERLLRQETGNK